MLLNVSAWPKFTEIGFEEEYDTHATGNHSCV
jgi:hypothetical protein